MQSKQQISLQDATTADSNTVYKLKKAALSPYVKKQYGKWDEAEQRAYHLARYKSNDIKIIMVDQRKVGFVSVVTESDCLNVKQLIIHPKNQGKGIGKHCMALIKQEAQVIELPIRLQLMKVNPRAMSFYQRIGFVVTGQTEMHYQMEFVS